MEDKRRENERIEKMLFDAQNELPTTNVEWRISEMKKEKQEKKSLSMLQRIAACVAIVMLLGIGGVTVLATAEIDVDGEFGTWFEITSNEDWEDCKSEMESRGGALPETLGVYRFWYFSTTLVVKDGTTYLEALQRNLYNPMCVTYCEGEPEDGIVSVFIGNQEDPFWSKYFGFKVVDGVWVAEDADVSFEYEGITVYGEEHYVETVADGNWRKMNWTWLDEKNGVVYSMYTEKNDMGGSEIVKEIIDFQK